MRIRQPSRAADGATSAQRTSVLKARIRCYRRLMAFRRRMSFLSALPVLLAALVLGACGGGDEGAPSSGDVDALLEQTFSGDKKIESGVVDLKLALDAQGGQQDGAFDITLAGPFQTQGAKQLPRFAMTAKV